MKQLPAIGLLWLLMARFASAHDPGLSSLTLQCGAQGLAATMVLSVADAEGIAPIDTNRDGRVSEAEFKTARPRLEEALLDACELKDKTEILPALSATAAFDLNDGIEVRWNFPPVDGEVTLRAAVLELLPRGHRQFASVVDHNGRPLNTRVLDVKNASLNLVLPKITNPILASTGVAEPPRPAFGAGRWFGFAMLTGLVAVTALVFRRRVRSA